MAFRSLFRWLLSWRLRRQPVRVVLYTRHGCHLCEQAWEQLLAARARYQFALEAIDVDSALDLAARFGEQVPVVMVNGKVRFQGRINGTLLDRLLRAESRRGRQT